MNTEIILAEMFASCDMEGLIIYYRRPEKKRNFIINVWEFIRTYNLYSVTHIKKNKELRVGRWYYRKLIKLTLKPRINQIDNILLVTFSDDVTRSSPGVIRIGSSET